jgi:hypothetical protein
MSCVGSVPTAAQCVCNLGNRISTGDWKLEKWLPIHWWRNGAQASLGHMAPEILQNGVAVVAVAATEFISL